MPYKHVKEGKVYFTNRPNGSTIYVSEDNQEFMDSLNPPELTTAMIYDQTIQNNKLIKALAMSLNSAGAFSIDGDVLSNSDLKALIVSNM